MLKNALQRILTFFQQKLTTAKDSHIFSTKNNSVFVTLADICLTNLCLNDIVKLTMLWTTGSWSTIFLLCQDGFTASWVLTSTNGNLCVLLKDTTYCSVWGSNPEPLNLESDALPLGHCAPEKLIDIKFWFVQRTKRQPYMNSAICYAICKLCSYQAMLMCPWFEWMFETVGLCLIDWV